MNVMREFLPPRKPLLEAVVEALSGRVRRLESGALSLAHLVVLVPTSQSARRLREALARKFGALVAPAVMTPPALVQAGGARGECESASRAEELATLAKMLESAQSGEYPDLLGGGAARERSFREALDLADSLLRVWTTIAENALSSRDVMQFFASGHPAFAPSGEEKRWSDLATLEEKLVKRLAEKKLVASFRRAALAVEAPPVFEGVEEVILAGLLSPLPAALKILDAMGVDCTAMIHASQDEAEGFDDFGRVKPGAAFLEDLAIPDDAIVAYADATAEADGIRRRYLESGRSRALVIADADFYPDAESSFLMAGSRLYDPSRMSLSRSSLGRLAAQVLALALEPRAAVFAAFIRQGDVQRWLACELEISQERMTDAIAALDKFVSRSFPRTMSEIAESAEGDLKAIAVFVAEVFAPFTSPGLQAGMETVRGVIERILAVRKVDVSSAEGRELIAAADALAQLFDAVSPLTLDFNDAALVFSRSLEECEYQLEEDPVDCIRAEGWLEMPFIDASKVVVSGMNEGAVPESVLGHAFVPDSLRGELGLYTNEDRAARDAFVLREAFACRTPGDVTISFHTLAPDSSVLKPSRLLLRTSDDRVLANRVLRFYAEPSALSDSRGRTLPDKWRLRLPIPPPHEPLPKISVSMLDTYLKCPFTYFLKRHFKSRLRISADEMDSAEFGTVAHAALELWTNEGGKGGEDPQAISDALIDALERIGRERFGASPSALIALQLDAIARRLGFFAECEAAHRSEGWTTLASELPFRVRYGAAPTYITGRVDRLDFNPSTGEVRVIDYKTWDTLSRGSAFSTDKKDVAFAESRGIALASPEKTWKSLQLPIYCDMVEANAKSIRGLDPAAIKSISASYAILGKSQAETGYSETISSEDWHGSAKEVLEFLLGEIERGVFWPPSPADLWQTDFGELFFDTPSASIDKAWIDDIEKRVWRRGENWEVSG